MTTGLWETLELPGVGSLLQALQARIEAGLGLTEEAREHATAALAVATETGTSAAAVWAEASLGLLELGLGRPEAAVPHLAAVAATFDGRGLGEPGVLWWAADLVEALWRVGDLVGARRRLEIFRAQADATGRLWAKATAARGAGLLTSTSAEVEAAFAEALRWHDRLDSPFERARTLLCLGERRLGLGHRDAASPLHEALGIFERLGAQPWMAQARRLLGDERPGLEPGLLTRQEQQVAAVVGRGATNREAADELFLSPRTIDFHLRNIYKKLHIRSRTELAVHLATQTPNPPPSLS